MSDILFRPTSDVEAFSVKEFFQNRYFAQGLNKVDVSGVFRATPSLLFGQIKEIAEARFGYTLPDQKKLLCLQSVMNKISLLRDLCQCLGF